MWSSTSGLIPGESDVTLTLPEKVQIILSVRPNLSLKRAFVIRSDQCKDLKIKAQELGHRCGWEESWVCLFCKNLSLFTIIKSSYFLIPFLNDNVADGMLWIPHDRIIVRKMKQVKQIQSSASHCHLLNHIWQGRENLLAKINILASQTADEPFPPSTQTDTLQRRSANEDIVIIESAESWSCGHRGDVGKKFVTPSKKANLLRQRQSHH